MRTRRKPADRNLFGGKNPKGLYVPMTPDEQEVVHRLVEAGDLQVVVHGWGTVDRPRVIVGDHRVGVLFRLTFNRPEVPMPVFFFDLELRTRTGLRLVKERLPTVYNGRPVQVAAGMFLDLQWDIAIHSMDPRLVKAIKPGATGLTSLRQDKDTGEMTSRGNMKLDGAQMKALAELEAAQAQVRQDDLTKVVDATKKAGYKVTRTADGIAAPDLE